MSAVPTREPSAEEIQQDLDAALKLLKAIQEKLMKCRKTVSGAMEASASINAAVCQVYEAGDILSR